MLILAGCAWDVPLEQQSAPPGFQKKAQRKDVRPAPSNKKTGKKPLLVLSETAHEFEPVADGTVVRHDFIIQNRGEGPLYLRRINDG